jgi:LysR family nitrogen assimilation transcriptional regulator
MHLKQLKSFLIVYEEGSLGRAATRCHTSQPGLSTQIASLEAELNVKLFHRHPRGISPTAAGQYLYARGKELLEGASTIVREIQKLSGIVMGTVTAGMSPALGKAILAPVLTQFVEKYPGVELRVTEDYSATLISLLENRLLDFALVMHIPSHETIQFEHIYHDRFIAVSSRKNGFAEGEPIPLNVPPYYKLVIPSVRHGVQSLLDAPLRTGHIIPARLIEVNSVSGVLEFVAESDWIALVPSTTIYRDLDHTRLQVNPIGGDPIRVEYYVAHLATEPLSAGAQAFISLVKAKLNELPRTLSARGPTAATGGSAKRKQQKKPRVSAARSKMR